MKDYFLCDIHFHTNKSFDNSYKTFDFSKLVEMFNGSSVETNVKLVCFTDHNVFDYNDYCIKRNYLKSNGIYCLPGIEVNSTNKVHWIFIFDDNELDKSTSDATKFGTELEKGINNFYEYDLSKPIIKQAEQVQLKPIDIGKFIDLLNDIGIEYIAIPHFDKSCGGWFNQLKKDSEQRQLLDFYIKDNIINGVESKQIKEIIKKKMVSTQTHLGEYIELYNKIDCGNETEKSQALEEINKRKDFLRKMYQIKESLDLTSVVYGSDYHGKNEYEKENLFIMKSELSFNGLKFALLDFESRIFSINKYKNCLKNNNYIIDKVLIEENGKEKEIHFGDGLNCVIGSRGSGKTYFLSMLLGDTQKYTTISKTIKLKKITYLNHEGNTKLSNEMFDYVAQKTNTNSYIPKSKSNIYDLLARAPYDYKEFENELKKSFNKEPNFKNEINEFIDLANNLLNKYVELLVLRNKAFDYGFIDSYNEYYLNQKENFEVYDLFVDFNQKLCSSITNKSGNLQKISDYREEYHKYVSLLNELFKIPEVKKSIDGELFRNYIEIGEKLNLLIVDKSKEKLNINKSNLDKVQFRVSKVINKMKNEASNSQRILNDSMTNLKKYIAEYIRLLKEIKQLNNELKGFNSKKLVNESIYKYSQGESSLSVRITKECNIEELSKDTLTEIFENYNNVYDSSIIKKAFLLDDFGQYYLNEVYSKKDGRRTSRVMKSPSIEPSIFLKSDNESEKNWLDLSPGQRSDMLLNIILLNDSNKILIIDQPEDDLDNETIFKKIVKRIRDLKVKRQIIIVTHNANLAITADCDYFVICNSTDVGNYYFVNDSMESNNLYRYQSLNGDNNIEYTALEIATEILDGGKEALRHRVRKIGYKNLFLRKD